MREEGESIPKFIENTRDLEKITRSEHRLITKDKKIWHRDQCFVHMTREKMTDEQADLWLKKMNFKVISYDEAYPNAKSELAKALKDEPQMAIKNTK